MTKGNHRIPPSLPPSSPISRLKGIFPIDSTSISPFFVSDEDEVDDAFVLDEESAVDEAVEAIVVCSSSSSIVNDTAAAAVEAVDAQLSALRVEGLLLLATEPTSDDALFFLFCCCVLLMVLWWLFLLPVVVLSIFKKSSKCRTATQGLISSYRGARVVPSEEGGVQKQRRG